MLFQKRDDLFELLSNVAPSFGVGADLVLNNRPEFVQAPTCADKRRQLVLDQSVVRQSISQELVLALIGSLAGGPCHQDVLEGLDIFEELLCWIHGSPLLSDGATIRACRTRMTVGDCSRCP